MTPDALSRLISDLQPLAPHAEYLRTIARPSVDIQLGAGPGDKARSRFGGSPYVPSDFTWPTHEQGVYRFLGQINFADIISPPAILPASGLLSFFFADQDDRKVSDDSDDQDDESLDDLLDAEDAEIFWRDPGYVIAYYWHDANGFGLRQSTVRETKNTAIQLTSGLDLPRHRVLRNDWPFDDEAAAGLFDEVRRLGMPFQAYLLGYPSFSTLGYDPTPGNEWFSLFNVQSILDWCWHDGDKLMVFIEKERLAKRDFSHLKCDAG